MTPHTTFVRLRTGLRKRLFVIDTLIGAVLCAVLAGVAIIGGAVVFRASAIPIAFIPVVVLGVILAPVLGLLLLVLAVPAALVALVVLPARRLVKHIT